MNCRPALLAVAIALSSCASSADDYRLALTTPDWSEASAACRRLAPGPDETCLLAAMETLDRRERADCDALSSKQANECRFLLAERHARAGDAEEAMKTCTTTSFARECSYHLVREAARTVTDATPAEAAPTVERWSRMPSAPDAPRLFWKAWFRERVALGLPADPTTCADDFCRQGARETLFSSLNARARARDATLCAAPPAVPHGWVETEETRRWVQLWTAQECAQRAGGAAAQTIAPPP